MAKKPQILVIGNNENGFSPYLERVSYDTGKEVAHSGAVLITGGLGGVMKAASQGAKEAGGLVIGIIPQNEASFANEYCDIVIPTGLGLARDFLTALSGDCVIMIGGGSGTLAEACAAYMHKRPIVAIRNTGGMADRYADQYIDHREQVKIIGVDSPRDAVRVVLDLIRSK
ncbi:MAG: TIGR00725 family protein [Thaumarchaeota archaeon]|nr:TIGR00725 family protein [Nitrososphaerota archaeon]